GITIDDGDIISTGNAKINLTGQGSTTGTQLNYGFSTSGDITSVTGDITIEGTGGGNAQRNYGIFLRPNGQIISTGNAKINLTGQGSTSGTNDNYGIVVDGVNSKITSATGDVTVLGTG